MHSRFVTKALAHYRGTYHFNSVTCTPDSRLTIPGNPSCNGNSLSAPLVNAQGVSTSKGYVRLLTVLLDLVDLSFLQPWRSLNALVSHFGTGCCVSDLCPLWILALLR